MTPDDFVAFLGESRASAILRTSIPGAAEAAMEAAVRGGFRVIEFTLTTPGALDLIADFAGRPGLVVGAGTVLTPDEARSAAAAGSRFLVSPVVDEAVIEEGRRLGLAVMPGAHTPTELMRAHRGGAPLQKLFPAPASVPQFIGSVLGPLPFLRLVPTNGVDANNAAACLEAGNRDENVFPNADKLIIDRKNARSHVAFGFGIHRCMGNRLAEMQLRVLWEEIMERFEKIELVGDVVRLPNNFIRGIAEVPVILHPK